MCGINGFVYNQPASAEQNAAALRKMNSLITYRGPDDEGVFVNDSVAIGMRRLSIIDLCTGNQPIFNEDQTKLIVFNGEIYNFHKLRDELAACGHIFKTKADTETILHAYEEYGSECLDKLNGMFAFAIYDLKTGELFIARDRAGEKPLYYCRDDDKFVFASELKSILGAFDIKKEINKDALNRYLSLTYIPAPLTIFNNIFKLNAGCYMTVRNGDIDIHKYWDIRFSEESEKLPYEEYKRQLRSYLTDSVEKKMISDVPLGAFLSGGIDSSIITGIMSRLSPRPVETFTIGFRMKEFDESDRAGIVAKKNNTNHHLHYLEYEDAVKCLDDIIATFDEPFADSSAIPTYFVSKYAGEFVKVVLTGDAGDELFGGYSKYMINYYADMYGRIPQGIRKHVIEKLVYSLPDKSSVTRKVKKVISNTGEDLFEKRRNLMLLGFNGSNIQSLLLPEYRIPDCCSFIRGIYDTPSVVDELTKTLYTDFKVVLEGDMLVKVDRVSMLNSIETRVPLLDRCVMELAFNIPSEYKIKGRLQKYILKDTFSDLLPGEILGKGKRGFAVPIGEWFRGPLKTSLMELLSEKFIKEQGIFNIEFVNKLLDDHFSARSNNYSQLWTLYTFQRWYLKYFAS
jgi:asparagine synthase (glutamine-hydrolysing)